MASRVNRLLGGLAFILLTFFVACGGSAETKTPTTAPASAATAAPQAVIFPTPPNGWNLYSRSSYQIALPGDWQEVKLQKAELQAAIAAAQNSNPPLADTLRALLDSGQYTSFIFYAIAKTGAPILQNISVARLDLEGTPDLQAFAKAYANALPNTVRGAKLIELQAPLKVNGMDAAEVSYDISLVDNQAALATVRGVQYLYRLDSGDAYLVTVTGDAKQADTFLPLAREIATSFVGVTP